MLSKELAIYHCERGRALPDRLSRQTHAHYVTLARRLIELYRRGAGRTREELHRQAETFFADEPDCPPQRVRALVRLLDQASEYRTDAEGRAFRLRLQVFEQAAARHPLVVEPDALFQHRESDVKAAIAARLGRPWDEIEAEMYSDLPAFHRLIRLGGYSEPRELLRAYNVAQAQALLYWAEELSIVLRSDYKRVLRRAKLSGLLHEVEALPRGEGYRITLAGPASVLRETRRYGVNMACFLPALLACKEWKMSARLRLPYGISMFQLSTEDQLQSHLPATEPFDSEVERALADKFGEHRDGWTLARESDVLVKEQRVFFPDFTFRHEDGTVVHLEIVGFWTPEYLAAKARTLALFADAPIIVAIAVAVADQLPPLPARVIRYATRLKLKPLLEELEAMRGKAVSRR